MNPQSTKGWKKQYDTDEVFYFSRSADQKKWIANLLSQHDAAIRRETGEKLEKRIKILEELCHEDDPHCIGGFCVYQFAIDELSDFKIAELRLAQENLF